MYILRPVKNGVETTLPPCHHYAKKSLDKAAALKDDQGRSLTGGRTGLELELTLLDNSTYIVILPDDADLVYVMNSDGDTIDTIYYPPRPKK